MTSDAREALRAARAALRSIATSDESDVVEYARFAMRTAQEALATTPTESAEPTRYAEAGGPNYEPGECVHCEKFPQQHYCEPAEPAAGLDAPLEIPSFDGRLKAYLGQGQDCVLVQIIEGGNLMAGIVLTPDAAETMARSLNKRAEYARLSQDSAAGGDPK